MRESDSYQRLIEDALRRALKSGNKLFLLDFDGTLVDFSDKVAGAIPPPELLGLLDRLTALPGCTLVIITGRSRETIEHLFSGLNVDIVAEHGAIIRENGKWKNCPGINNDWKNRVRPVIENIFSILPGSEIEEKSFSIAWHYRGLDDEAGTKYARQLIRQVNGLSKELNLRVIDGNKVVEIIHEKINKGSATQYLLTKKNYDFILSIGDDRTDEDMFRTLAGNSCAFTVKTGSGNTSAGYSLRNVRQVNRLLEQLLKRMESNNY